MLDTYFLFISGPYHRRRRQRSRRHRRRRRRRRRRHCHRHRHRHHHRQPTQIGLRSAICAATKVFIFLTWISHDEAPDGDCGRRRRCRRHRRVHLIDTWP